MEGILQNLTSMQRRAATWITGAFRTSPTGGVQALAGLIPIHLHYSTKLFHPRLVSNIDNRILETIDAFLKLSAISPISVSISRVENFCNFIIPLSRCSGDKVWWV